MQPTTSRHHFSKSKCFNAQKRASKTVHHVLKRQKGLLPGENVEAKTKLKMLLNESSYESTDCESNKLIKNNIAYQKRCLTNDSDNSSDISTSDSSHKDQRSVLIKHKKSKINEKTKELAKIEYTRNLFEKRKKADDESLINLLDLSFDMTDLPSKLEIMKEILGSKKYENIEKKIDFFDNDVKVFFTKFRLFFVNIFCEKNKEGLNSNKKTEKIHLLEEFKFLPILFPEFISICQDLSNENIFKSLKLNFKKEWVSQIKILAKEIITIPILFNEILSKITIRTDSDREINRIREISSFISSKNIVEIIKIKNILLKIIKLYKHETIVQYYEFATEMLKTSIEINPTCCQKCLSWRFFIIGIMPEDLLIAHLMELKNNYLKIKTAKKPNFLYDPDCNIDSFFTDYDLVQNLTTIYNDLINKIIKEWYPFESEGKFSNDKNIIFMARTSKTNCTIKLWDKSEYNISASHIMKFLYALNFSCCLKYINQ